MYMRSLSCLCFLALLLGGISASAQTEARYSANNGNLPEWVQLMYAESPDAGAVEQAYARHYQTHAFVKNQHTQYYKR